MNLLQTLQELKHCTKLIKSQTSSGMVTTDSGLPKNPKFSSNLKSFGVGFKSPEPGQTGPTDPKFQVKLKPSTNEEIIADAQDQARAHFAKSCVTSEDLDALAAFHDFLITYPYVPARETWQRILILTNRLFEREQFLIKKLDECIKMYLEASINRANMAGR